MARPVGVAYSTPMPCEQVRMNGRILDPIPSPTPILFRPVKAVYGDSESTRVEGQERRRGEIRGKPRGPRPAVRGQGL